MIPPETRILVVDDTSMMRTMVMKELRAAGITNLYEADHGIAGLALLKAQFDKKEPIDFILSDWQMPQMQGIDFLRAVRKDPNFGKIPFLMITAKNDVTEIKAAVLAGVSDYIVKPFNHEKLIAKVRAIWEKLHG